jgi:hypothetical protein
MIHVTVVEQPAWPKLAWLANVRFDLGRVVLHCGSAVERVERGLVEGVWDAPFDQGFTRAEHFFGSGILVGAQEVTIVPSAALVDRVLLRTQPGGAWISNSLAALLGMTDGLVVPSVGTVRSMSAIRKGIEKYDATLPLANGDAVSQLYYHNYVLSPAGLQRSPKAAPRPIETYAEYRDLLAEAMERLGHNARDRARRTSVALLGTMSRGYDSPAACLLGKRAGLRACFTATRSNSLAFLSSAATEDDGSPIASLLDLEIRPLGLLPTKDELYYLAGSFDPETIFSDVARTVEQSGDLAVLFTGYHGDMAWRSDAFDDEERAPAVIRHDISGLNLTEIRLKAGFFNVAVPFILVRSQASITRISQSAEMAEWRLGTDYDRPIPRRLLEEAGVPRELFGVRKKAILERPHWPQSTALRSAFVEDLARETGHSASLIARSVEAAQWLELPVQAVRRLGWRHFTLTIPRDVRTRLFAWAVNRLAADFKTHARQ